MAITSMRSIGTNRQSVRIRMAFLFVQYVLTVGIIIVSLYFGKHLHFLQSTPPGFRTENILIADLQKERKLAGHNTIDIKAFRARITLINQKLNECPYIESYMYNSKLFSQQEETFISDKNEQITCLYMAGPAVFFDLYDIPVIEGQIPQDGRGTLDDRVILNRTALKAFGYTHHEEAFLYKDNDTPIEIVNPDWTIADSKRKKSVVAVVEDFYNGHLTQGIKPIVFIPGKNRPLGEVTIRIRPGQEKACIDYLRKMVKELYNTDDFTYTWLKDDVKKLYEEDRQVTVIYMVFALIAIAISCLGLFGISLFDIRQRYREIALRKVHGAGMKNLYQLLFKKYLLVLGAAFMVAVPVAYYLIHQYTADFTVKAPIGIGIFMLALLLVALISTGTLWWQIHKAANINPAVVMKKE